MRQLSVSESGIWVHSLRLVFSPDATCSGVVDGGTGILDPGGLGTDSVTSQAPSFRDDHI